VEAVASGDEVALKLSRRSFFAKLNRRHGAIEIVHADILGLENDLTAGGDARGDQILDDFMLSVNCDGLAAGQLAQIDAMSASAEAQLDSVMSKAFTLHPLADAGFDQQIDGALLKQAGADSLLDVLPAARLEHDGLDALKVEQMREHQPGGSRTDNPDLGAQIHVSRVARRTRRVKAE
jgi:hypothetical protein